MRHYGRLGAILAVALTAAMGFAGAAVADTGSNATTVPIIVPSNAANQMLQSDEPVQLVVPDGDFTPNEHVNVYECSDPTGSITAAFLDTLSVDVCDALTNVPYPATASGGLTTPDPTVDPPGSGAPPLNDAYVVFSLPNRPELDERTSNAKCDLSDECILYLGPSLSNPADGAGVVYSTPFNVNQNYDYLAGDPAPPPPAVTKVSPSSGPTSGGTTVTITGTSFTGATKVLFGTVAATSFTVVSATEITAVSPAQAAATHNIYVTTPGGTSAAVTADEFTYV